MTCNTRGANCLRMKTMRRSVAFSDRQLKWLTEQSIIRRRSIASIVRGLVDDAIDPLMKELRETTVKAMLPALIKKVLND